MTCFIDTSAFFALLDSDDANHNPARNLWSNLVTERTALVSSNYVLLETIVLLQNRLGVAAVRGFHEDIVPLIGVEWVDHEIHSAGMAALLSSGKRALSLVDCTSFEVMRRLGIKKAFVFDRHFKQQGFQVLA